MLQLLKNQVVTSVAKQQVEIRQLELDWYTNNYWTLSQQAALLAGFAFSQITTSLPEHLPFALEASYLLLAALSLGLQLCVIITTTFCCMWGPGLALRGPDGVRSVDEAVDKMKGEQGVVFFLFVLGTVCFFVSNVLLLWCYFESNVAAASSLFMGGFVLLIIYYSVTLTYQLRVRETEAVEGNIDALRAYGNITDLDACYAARVPQVDAAADAAAAAAAAEAAAGRRGTSFRPQHPMGMEPVYVGTPEEAIEGTPQGFLGTILELFDWD
ncbi:hypothetical protein, conserved [Eimeria necatrix]|uniref:Transmembrane protein n=1 Tax=Eimeria necatrix TaxID=51315 RepID=U6MTP0_9EIME|nr:hypothetical protein, conserved [Eimeria necatrix]CDJ66463.1 hypothetical protein, conserved [Eimeria necatrix]